MGGNLFLSDRLLQEIGDPGDGQHRPNHDPADKAQGGYLLCDPFQKLHNGFKTSGLRLKQPGGGLMLYEKGISV